MGGCKNPELKELYRQRAGVLNFCVLNFCLLHKQGFEMFQVSNNITVPASWLGCSTIYVHWKYNAVGVCTVAAENQCTSRGHPCTATFRLDSPRRAPRHTPSKHPSN